MKKNYWFVVFLKYALIGALAAVCELSALHWLTVHTTIWYVYASALCSALSFVIGFVLRKIWAFEDRRWDGLSRQLFFYLLSLFLVVGANTLLMSFLVEHFALPYLEAQFFAGILTGLIGFIINRNLTFRYRR